MYLSISNKISTKKTNDNDCVYLIYQFFVHGNAYRNKELKQCLRLNVENPHIDKIFLLNERNYTTDELGIESEKIEQRNIVNRIKFKDIFNFVEEEKLTGYIITCNADIFFDKTVNNLRMTEMASRKQMLSQLRFDYTNNQLGKCKLFGPRADSQDTWIWHSNYNPHKEEKIFNIMFGKPGCDNKLIYLLNLIGFDVVNQPYFVKTYHIQKNQERDYSGTQPLPGPYMLVSPYIEHQQMINTAIWGTVGRRLQKDHNTTIESVTHDFSRFMFGTDNKNIREYLKMKFDDDERFIIPQTNKDGTILTSTMLVLNNVTQGTLFQSKQITPEYQNNIQVKNIYFNLLNMVRGIPDLQHIINIIEFTNKYMESFNKSDICMGFSNWDTSYRELMNENKMGLYKPIMNIFNKKKWLSTTVLNIFNHLHNDPWINQLNNKKLLIISPNADKIEEQISSIVLKKLYGFDIFTNCEFCFIKFSSWNNSTQTELINNIGEYDIALCDCGLYGSVVSNYVYIIGKSAIDIGDILPLYFGLWNSSHMINYKNIIQLYLNEHWKRL